MNETVIHIENFRKTYGPVVAVDNVNFEVHRGEIFGLLGPNGAGKTSTLECLEGLRSADGGSMDILGVDPGKQPRKLSSLIGVQLQTSGLLATMQVEEAIRFFCAYHNVAARYDLIARLGLEEKRRAQYGKLSTGQQRRLALALAVAHKPAVLFLDEPTAGLDVESRSELHTLVRELQEEGTTIILATHDMAEAEKMADRVAILLRGKIVASGTPREITTTGAGYTKISARSERSILHNNGIVLPGVTQSHIDEDYAIYFSNDTGATVAALLEHLKQQNDPLLDLRVERPSLEERFLEITTEQEA